MWFRCPPKKQLPRPPGSGVWRRQWAASQASWRTFFFRLRDSVKKEQKKNIGRGALLGDEGKGDRDRWPKVRELWLQGRELYSYFFLGCGGVSGVSGRRSCCWIAAALRRGRRRGGESTGLCGFPGQRVQEHRRVGGCPPPPFLPLYGACVFLAHVSVEGFLFFWSLFPLFHCIFQRNQNMCSLVILSFRRYASWRENFSWGETFYILHAGTIHVVLSSELAFWESLRKCRDMKPR